MGEKRRNEKARWRLEDLIAFECALAKDEREDWSVLRARDAEMALDEGVLASGSRRAILLDWLRKRMAKQPEIKLAADSVVQSLSVAGQLVGVAAALLGMAAAAGALAYAGDEAINVSAFFGIFVLLQGILGVAMLVVFLLPGRVKEALAFGPLFRLGRWVLDGVFARVQALAGRFLSGQRRQDAAEIAGEARRSFAVHGAVAKWVVFTKVQAAALCFNLGALAAFLIAVAFSDRAFGWQTTLDVSAEMVHALAETVALPWAWLWGEGLGYPDPSQVEGSRIVLKEGIRSLESENLAAWWRFLALGILVYGILPRALFYGLGRWQRWSSLARYDFRYALAERLMERLRPDASRFEIEAVRQGADWEGHALSGTGNGGEGSEQRVLCLCSRELAAVFDLEDLKKALLERWKLPAGSIEARGYEEGRMAEGLETLERKDQIAVVFESWMPPIKEIERQLKELRKSIDEHALIKLVLLGISPEGGEAVSLKPELQYAEAWYSFARRLGDPYLILENPAS